MEPIFFFLKRKLSACRGEGSLVGPLLAVPRCRRANVYTGYA
jgi:hypothetical protein